MTLFTGMKRARLCECFEIRHLFRILFFLPRKIMVIKLLISLVVAVVVSVVKADGFRELHELFNRVVPISLEDSPEGKIEFGLFDTSMGEMMLEMWHEAKSSRQKFEVEDRIRKYAASCSKSFLRTIFINFEAEITRRNTKRENIDSLASEIDTLRSLLGEANAKRRIIQAEFQEFYERFNLVYKYMSSLMNSNHTRVKHFGSLSDKKRIIMSRAMDLRHCEISQAQWKQNRFIDYLENLREEHDLSPSFLFDLCRDAFTDVIQQKKLANKRQETHADIASLEDRLKKSEAELVALLDTQRVSSY